MSRLVGRSAVALLLIGCAGLTGRQSSSDRSPRLPSHAGPNGHVMVVIPGGEFSMGSPEHERGRDPGETQHRVRIPRTFAVATTEVTDEQFARFLAAVPEHGARWRAATARRFGDPPREDVEDSVLQVSNEVARTRRGGSFAYEWFTTRSAHRGDTTYLPNQTRDNVGFRVARTISDVP